MKTKYNILIGFTALTLHFMPCRAEGLDSLRVAIRAAYNLGGTMPVPLPATIRSIDAFRPTVSFRLGADAMKPLGERWGISAGLYLESKGMDAEVSVKSYHMEMVKGTSQLSGLFTGHVKQETNQWMLTLPVQITCRVSDVITLKVGPFASLLISKDFSGIAFDGYLRQGDPTGPRIDIGDTEGEWASYDFGDNLRSLQWGMDIDLDWYLNSRLGLSIALEWGLSGIFQSIFKTVEQALYPVYGSVGVLYKL